MIRLYKKLAVAAAIAACSTFASADPVIWNQSRSDGVGSVGGDLYIGADEALENRSTGSGISDPGRSWSDVVWFATGATITGMDIYTLATNPNAVFGAAVTIRVWSQDPNGFPDGAIFATRTTTILSADIVTGGERRLHAEFDDVVLDGDNDYWFSMSGTGNSDIGQFGVIGATTGTKDGSNVDIDGLMATYLDTAYASTSTDGFDMLFRLSGVANPLVAEAPEPASLALLGLGLLGLGWSRRKKA